MKIREKDIVLFKPRTGKIWKICKVFDVNNNNPTQRYLLENQRAKIPTNSCIKASSLDIIIPIKKSVDIESMNIRTLVTLYADSNVDINDTKIFKSSKTYNIQINSKNKANIDKLIQLINDNGIILDKVPTRNTNISAKYVLKENK